MENLKSDWIISNSAFLFVEDSLIFTDIRPEENRIFKYSIINDSVIFHPITIPDKNKDCKAVFKIEELTKRHFHITFVKSTIHNFYFEPNNKFNFTTDTTLRNNKTLKTLEFSSTNGMGYTSTIDMKINEDSMLYIMGYNHYARFEGLYQHKLTRNELERINRKINRINLSSFSLEIAPLDASFYTLIIETTDNNTYKSEGSIWNSKNYNLNYLIQYLINIDRLLKFEKSKNDILKIHETFNRKMYDERMKNNYAP